MWGQPTLTPGYDTSSSWPAEIFSTEPPSSTTPNGARLRRSQIIATFAGASSFGDVNGRRERLAKRGKAQGLLADDPGVHRLPRSERHSPATCALQTPSSTCRTVRYLCSVTQSTERHVSSLTGCPKTKSQSSESPVSTFRLARYWLAGSVSPSWLGVTHNRVAPFVDALSRICSHGRGGGAGSVTASVA
jgi:hypothetical protein